MSWEVKPIDEARRDIEKLAGSQHVLVLKTIRKVWQNPRRCLWRTLM